MFIKVKTNESGEILSKEKEYFGGEYSFIEKVKMGGIGSVKIIYENGIEEFDALGEYSSNEISFVNFEELKNGLILRLNRNQRTQYIGIRISDIEQISLVGFRIAIRTKSFRIRKEKIVHRGILEIIDKEKNQYKFKIISSNFKNLKKYFERESLKEKFNYEESKAPPERDFGHLMKYFDWLN